MTERDRYVLGTDDHELERLELQQSVWSDQTDAWIDLLALERGERVLDAGCGPGLATARLRDRVGPEGRVVAVDASPRWIEHLTARIDREGWTETEARCASLEALGEEGAFDAIFMRWVLSFPREPERVLTALGRALAPGGRLVVVDYNHEGVSLFPRSAGFDAVIRATRALYETKGGSAFVAGRFPALFDEAGLELVDQQPHVICGRPGEPAFQWADTFFPYHVEHMVEAGVLTTAERERFLAEWSERRANPHTTFYSPIVVAALGVRRQR